MSNLRLLITAQVRILTAQIDDTQSSVPFARWSVIRTGEVEIVSSVPRRRAGDVRIDSGRANAPISVLVLDANRVLREGIAAMVFAHRGFEVLAPGMDVREAMACLVSLAPDVVLIGGEGSLALTERVHVMSRASHIVVMGVLPLGPEISEHLRAGASAFVVRDASFQVLLATIHTAAHGARVVPSVSQAPDSAEIATPRQLRPAVGPAGQLTLREQEVIALLGDGLSNKEIALRLAIAVHTVKSHVHNVLEKLSLRSRLEVAAFARHSAEMRVRGGHLVAGRVGDGHRLAATAGR